MLLTLFRPDCVKPDAPACRTVCQCGVSAKLQPWLPHTDPAHVDRLVASYVAVNGMRDRVGGLPPRERERRIVERILDLEGQLVRVRGAAQLLDLVEAAELLGGLVGGVE